MENIKHIKRITDEIKRTRVVAGDCVYYELTHNRAKAYCDEYGVWVEIINIVHGLVDKVHLPFSHYFEPVQCSDDAPLWTQSIERNGCWRFEERYPHLTPKVSDYKNIAFAMENYMEVFN